MQYPDISLDLQADDLLLKNHYDIVIIGSGVSCCFTLIHYISLLSARSQGKPVKIAIVEKSDEFWTGVPYGQKNGKHSLIISTLNEFLPQVELEKFKHWLDKNRSWVFDPLVDYKSGVLATKWLHSHSNEISAGLWDELFIPRYTFGLYLKELLTQLLEDAKSSGIVEYDRIEAEAVDVQKLNNLYQIETVQAQLTSFLIARKVVLAIGSPPYRKSDLLPSNNSYVHYVDDIYQPSQNFNIERIGEILQQSEPPQNNQVLIVGSNASAIEAVYSLVNSPKTSDSIGKFIVISPNASFPHRIVPPSSYEPKRLKAIRNIEHLTAKEILIAVQKDVDEAIAQNEEVGGMYVAVSKGIIAALNQLSPDEQKLFVSFYGVEIGKYQRRAGADYLDVIDQLVESGKLEFIKGKLVKTTALPSGEIGFEFSTTNHQENQIFATPVQVVVNCAGFQDLTSSASILIRNLIRQGICTPNNSKNGFEVSENFETSNNFYLIGPLIAGNMNSKFKIWHAESVPRIIYLSQLLAEILAQS